MPFTKASLDRLFKTQSGHPDRITSRESHRLECKQNFNWGSRDEYAKTMAAFANSHGGYLVFGITNSPRLLAGMRNDNFSRLDPSDIVKFLNSCFSPEVPWDTHIHVIGSKYFGLIHVHESPVKPIICKKNSGCLKEGAVYYRYRSSSELIRYAELSRLLEEERTKERRLWLKHIENMSRVGINNVGVLDTISGKLTGSSSSLLISRELLGQVEFINEGEFKETGGKPTLTVIGNVQPLDGGLVQPYKVAYRPRSIHAKDIVEAFLKQETVESPSLYIAQMCFENTHYLPVYYFIRQAGLSVEKCIEELKGVDCSAQHTRDNLIARLESGKRVPPQGVLNRGSEQSVKRTAYLQRLKNGRSKKAIPKEDHRFVLEAVTHLERDEFKPKYVLGVLRDIVLGNIDAFTGMNGTRMRQAVSHLDYLLFHPSVTTE